MKSTRRKKVFFLLSDGCATREHLQKVAACTLPLQPLFQGLGPPQGPLWLVFGESYLDVLALN